MHVPCTHLCTCMSAGFIKCDLDWVWGSVNRKWRVLISVLEPLWCMWWRPFLSECLRAKPCSRSSHACPHMQLQGQYSGYMRKHAGLQPAGWRLAGCKGWVGVRTLWSKYLYISPAPGMYCPSGMHVLSLPRHVLSMWENASLARSDNEFAI